MPDIAAMVSKARDAASLIGADLAPAGGILRCGTCGTEQPLGDVGHHLGHGWPQHCGLTMTWVTQRMLSWERRQPVPEGCELVAVPDKDWRLVTGRRCRMRGGNASACGKPGVAELDRGRRVRYGSGIIRQPSWWPYCIDHLYGRWLDDGKVMMWILREIPASQGGGLSG